MSNLKPHLARLSLSENALVHVITITNGSNMIAQSKWAYFDPGILSFCKFFATKEHLGMFITPNPLSENLIKLVCLVISGSLSCHRHTVSGLANLPVDVLAKLSCHSVSKRGAISSYEAAS